MKIISVSQVQGHIDWKYVRDADAAVIRFSYGCDIDCCLGIAPETDDLAETNLRGANQARISCGVSHLLGGTTASDVHKEAAWLISHLNHYKNYITLPIVVVSLGDHEIAAKYRTLSPAQNTNLIKIFCNIIKRAGYTPVLYANREILTEHIERKKLGSIGIWYNRPFVSEVLAQEEEPDMLFWQYSAETSPRNAGIYADYPVSKAINYFFRTPAPRFHTTVYGLYA